MLICFVQFRLLSMYLLLDFFIGDSMYSGLLTKDVSAQ